MGSEEKSESRPWTGGGQGRQLQRRGSGESRGWQGLPRDRDSWRLPEKKGGDSGRKGRPWPAIVPLLILGFTAPPPPSIRRRPGLLEARGGTRRASGLLGVRRVPALQVAQVDGLEGCRGTEWSVAAWTQRQGPGPVPHLPLAARGTGALCHGPVPRCLPALPPAPPQASSSAHSSDWG